MNRKNTAFLWVLSLLFSLFAQDNVIESDVKSNETEYKMVEGLENWKYNYDISELKDGKYNLIIRSHDKAGNLSIGGPYNIFVDSESDLPTISISSPSQSMRAGGNINVVGTANDDDGISFVEIKIDDGNYRRAEGTNFWSTLLDISEIEDGQHIIWARATDINGLQGNEISVAINVDKTKPVITIDSHSNGEILSGKKKISGFVSDANGVSRLEYSLDGISYRDVKLSGKDENTERSFSLGIDTRENEGGTSYIRFRTVDGTGSESSIVFVYYSDNEKPVISILSPQVEHPLNGIVTITGTVSDEVGIQSFTSSVDGGDEVEIELIAGNPYWTRAFDFRNEKKSTITFKAVDLSGNIEEYKMKIDLYPDEDKPLISLLDFTEDTLFTDTRIIKGIAWDDDGIRRIHYSIDEGADQSIETEGPFILNLEGLEPGKHTLEIHAEDILEISGDTEKFTFSISQKAPEIEIKEYISDKIVEPFSPGIVFQQGKAGKINGNIMGGQGDIIIKYVIGSEPEQTVKVSKGSFSLAISNKLMVGAYNITIKAIDSLERENLFSSRIYIAPSPAKGEIFMAEQQDDDGLFLTDSRLDRGNAANISRDKPLTGYITGDTIGSVELVPAQESFSVSQEGSRFTIIPLTDSPISSFALKIVTSGGKEYNSPLMKVASDFSEPELELKKLQVPVEVEVTSIKSRVEINENGEEVTIEESEVSIESEIIESHRVYDRLFLRGNFSDISEIIRTEISFSGSSENYGSARILETEFIDGKYVFNEEIDLSSLSEGKHFITVTIEDNLNNIISKTIPFIIDRTVPVLSIVSPGPAIPVEGYITVSGRINDFIDGGQVLFTKDGVNYTSVEMLSPTEFSHIIDLSAEGVNPENFQFRVIDQGRNQLDFHPQFNVDLESDRPKIAIEVPAEN
ncbi:MAG: hypothetical protein JEY91_13765, partial [Spirochaetaceae bacterium]|nr:hypothetical protein [Spirochaetaceae bacterium]